MIGTKWDKNLISTGQKLIIVEDVSLGRDEATARAVPFSLVRHMQSMSSVPHPGHRTGEARIAGQRSCVGVGATDRRQR